MTTPIVRPAASVTAAATTVTADGGSVSLDAARAPYAAASVDIPLLNKTLIETLDPRTPQRVTVTAGDDAAGSSRVFNLGLRSRAVDHAARTIHLELASDEAMLMEYAPLADDLGAYTYQSSIRAICNYVLGKISASLAASPSDDAPMPVLVDATNLNTDPRATSLVTFTTTNCTQALDGTFPGSVDGVPHNGVSLTAPTSNNAWLTISGDLGAMRLGMTAGKTYVASATGSVRSAVSGTPLVSALRLVLIYRVGTGSYVQTNSPALPTTVGASTRVSVEVALPVGTTEAFIRAYHGYTAGSVTWSQFRLTEKDTRPGVDNTEYFWGGKPATSDYSYAWTGGAEASSSTRKALINRAPELLTWTAGDDAWSFLQPVLTTAGLLLFCDESRVWRLVNPATYSVDGRVTVTPDNATEGSDSITRDDPAVYCTGVVVRYRWTDAAGVQRTQLDAAGTPGSIYRVELERPYPGPGAAAAILARRSGQGRTQDVTALARWDATPRMEASISLPGTVDQIGRVSAVEWGLTDGRMRVGTQGLTDAVPGSWLATDPAEAWPDGADIDWASWT